MLKLKLKIFENKDEDHPYDNFIKTKIDFSVFNEEKKIYEGSVESSYGYDYEIEDFETEEEEVKELNNPDINYMGLMNRKNLVIVVGNKNQKPKMEEIVRKMKSYHPFNIERVLQSFEDFVIFSHYGWDTEKQNPNYGLYSLSEEETKKIIEELK